RCFQRFALQATAIGVRTAHLNQPVELATLRPAFAADLGITNGRPDLVIRFGRGPAMPRSLRRPLDAVLL
ncbi:MAG: Tat pathway signal protein, partial [Thauera sp.]|nr:Tat pathway signal protein [Thauera sp.]